MRILIVSGALYGHVDTMLPIALAARDAGHSVVVASGPDFALHVERRGLRSRAVRRWLGGAGLDPRTRYLSSATDHADLERRMKCWDQHEERRLSRTALCL